MAIVEVRGASYYMHDGLKNKWDKIRDGKLSKVDEDRAYVTDGRERSGKSLFTIQQAAYIDPTILDDGEDGTPLPRITFSAKETLKAIRSTKSNDKETKVIIFDEAFRGMSSKGSLSKENKKLTTALMEMGQSNLVLFIVSPSFFLLELYPAMLRTNALFHISKDKKGKRRMFKVFNYKKKALLYQIGIRKGWGYPLASKQRGNFFETYPGGDDFEDRYRQKKLDSLKTIEQDENETHKWKRQRNCAIKVMSLDLNLTYEQISKYMKARGELLGKSQVGTIVGEKTEIVE